MMAARMATWPRRTLAAGADRSRRRPQAGVGGLADRPRLWTAAGECRRTAGFWAGVKRRRTMASMLTTARDGAWTVEDLAALPDDGLRYELVDGALLVTPPPGPQHQIAAYRLAKVLEAALPAHLRLLPGPVAVRTSAHRELQPDLSVAPASSVGPARLEGAPPALVVEVLSRSTRSTDLVLKRALYEEMGIGSYWVLDPVVPSLRAQDLVRVDDRVGVPLLGQEPLPVRGVVLVQGVARDDRVEVCRPAVDLGPQHLSLIHI